MTLTLFKSLRAFTLAELLIALSILGILATFTIPKVIQGSTQSQNISKFKETISTIEAILYEGVLSKELQTTYNGSLIRSKINAAKICPTDSSTQGCAPSFQIGTVPGQERNEPGVLLHNGVMIYGLNDLGIDVNGLIVDVNGETGPNTIGQDLQYLTLCAWTTCNNNPDFENIYHPTRYGRLSYHYNNAAFAAPANRDANKQLYLDIFK